MPYKNYKVNKIVVTKTTGIRMYRGHVLHLNLSECGFRCHSCGHVQDRDVSAANTTEHEGLPYGTYGRRS